MSEPSKAVCLAPGVHPIATAASPQFLGKASCRKESRPSAAIFPGQDEKLAPVTVRDWSAQASPWQCGLQRLALPSVSQSELLASLPEPKN